MAGRQITKLTGTVPIGTNQTLPHGLDRAPTLCLLGFGTGANVANPGGHDAASAKFNNTGGAGQPVNALLVALHSLDVDRVKQITGTCTAGQNNVPHGLPTAPDLVFVGVGSTGAVLTATLTKDATNIGIPGAANGDKYDLLCVSLHSKWGTGQWSVPFKGTHGNCNIATQVPGPQTNFAIPHGLLRTPDLVVLGARCTAGVALGQAADATNIYVNTTGASNVEALVIAGHSIIS